MCHPFFTGTQKIIDSAHRVEKFEARKSKRATSVRTKKTKTTVRRAKRAQTTKESAEKKAVEK